MAKFTPEQNQEMRDMYDLRNENDKRKYTQKEVAEHFGTSNVYVSIINKINPDTEEKFESHTEYNDYSTRQRINPDTGEPFESRTEYDKHIKKKTRQKNKNLEDRLGE